MDLTKQAQEWHPLTLPSLGYFYEDKVPDGKVMITPWTTVQEEMIAKYSGDSRVDYADALIQNNLALPNGFQYDQLMVSDFMFVMVQLRILSLCSSYSFFYPCTTCRKDVETHIMLDTLPVIVPDETWPREPIKVKLPKCKKEVGLRFTRLQDQKKVEELSKQSYGPTTHKLARQITEVNGKLLPYDERLAFVRSLALLDCRVIDNTLDKWYFGYQLDIDVNCAGCKTSRKVVLPTVATFFHPTASDIERETGLAGTDREGDGLPSDEGVRVEGSKTAAGAEAKAVRKV